MAGGWMAGGLIAFAKGRILESQDCGGARMPSEARPTIFLSYSGDESLEADLLQFAIEHLLQEVRARVWT